jgi:hypothetical protein
MKQVPVAVIPIVAAVVAACTLTPAALDPRCRVARDAAMLPDVPEASGVAVSRRHPGIVWIHNDSGNEPILFAVNAAGTVHARVRIPVRLRDWEDVSSAACPDGGACLYIGDIGDNRPSREQLQIFRVAEPALGDAHTRRPDVVTLVYADGPHDAEAMFIVGDDVFVVTKDPVGRLYRAPLPTGSGATTLQRIGQLDLARVTDAEAAPDGGTVAVRTPRELAVYRFADLAAGGAPRPVLRVAIDALAEPQGEGVALGPDGTVYLASEGGLWGSRGQLVTLRCAPAE